MDIKNKSVVSIYFKLLTSEPHKNVVIDVIDVITVI